VIITWPTSNCYSWFKLPDWNRSPGGHNRRIIWRRWPIATWRCSFIQNKGKRWSNTLTMRLLPRECRFRSWNSFTTRFVNF